MDRIEVIATDLDGTLLDNRGELSERSRKALLAARERGLLVVAVTARAPRSVARLPGLTDVIDAALCVNGAMRYEPLGRTAELRRAIPEATARRLLASLRAALPGAAFAVETGTGVIAQSRHFQHGVHFADPWTFVETADELLERAGTVVELKVGDPRSTAVRLIEAARRIDEPGVVMWSWGSHPLVEYNAEGVDKGRALAEWCGERGIGPGSVVAFGDMPNDIPMLAWAHRSYAVAAARPEVLGVATHRAGSNDDDGVARAVEALLWDGSGPADSSDGPAVRDRGQDSRGTFIPGP